MVVDLCKTELCTGCAACANSCPKQCIQMLTDTEGFLHPVVDEARCVDCGACQKDCPILHPLARNSETAAYAAVCKSDDIRRESTSGGVFSLLCQWVFDRSGVVFGAAFTDDFSVEHRCVRSMDELPVLRTAKYTQSRVGDSFQQVKKLLDDGQYVLFSGTPCQIGGLQAFLGRKYEKLILVDLVCHGVPVPSVWVRYIDYRRETDAPDSALASINLRSKETGWPGYSVCFDYQNGTYYSAKTLKILLCAALLETSALDLPAMLADSKAYPAPVILRWETTGAYGTSCRNSMMEKVRQSFSFILKKAGRSGQKLSARCSHSK